MYRIWRLTRVAPHQPTVSLLRPTLCRQPAPLQARYLATKKVLESASAKPKRGRPKLSTKPGKPSPSKSIKDVAVVSASVEPELLDSIALGVEVIEPVALEARSLDLEPAELTTAEAQQSHSISSDIEPTHSSESQTPPGPVQPEEEQPGQILKVESTEENGFEGGKAPKPVARFNEIGVQHVSDQMHRQLFGEGPANPPPPELVQLSKEHLDLHELLGKQSEPTDAIGFKLPRLCGNTLDEHFFKLGNYTAEPWLSAAKKFATATIPEKPSPSDWQIAESGWHKYTRDGKQINVEKCDYPDEECLVFDVEVLWKVSPYAVMACAASSSAWYSWISPQVTGESKTDKHLIPLGDPEKERVVIGHNVSYDRARIAEEYNLKQTGTFFLDTMSLHAAVNGMCSRQRPTWMKHKKNKELREKLLEGASPELQSTLENAVEDLETELWVERSSINSLRDVALFHTNTAISKEMRDEMSEMKGVEDLTEDKLRQCLDYCGADVAITHEVYKHVLPLFLETCSHPVSFSALRHMGSLLLPVNSSWTKYIENSEAKFAGLLGEVNGHLESLTEETVKISQGVTDQQKRLVEERIRAYEYEIGKEKKAEQDAEEREQGVQPPLGKETSKSKKTRTSKRAPTTKRISQLEKLLAQEIACLGNMGPTVDEEIRKIERNPWSKENAWISQLDWSGREVRYKKKKHPMDPLVPVARQKMPGYPTWYKGLFAKSGSPMSISVRTRLAPLMLRLQWDGYPLVWTDKYGWTFRVPYEEAERYEDTPMVQCKELSEESNPHVATDTEGTYFKLPHNGNGTTRCVNPLAKGYQRYFEEGVLTSEYPQAKEALEMNAACSYWISARERIKSQFVVWERDQGHKTDFNMGFMPSIATADDKNDLGLILPQIVTMGTITRRAVENTWLTASNAKKNRVGSELKAMIQAPPGYCFVGADVDSEELWIASLIGDAEFKMHGGNAIGFMTLEGSKAAGTDMHSRTAGVLGISRNDAKIFNYGRIYGAGLKFAASLLRQFNPSVNESQADAIASNLYEVTKGVKTTRKVLRETPFWRGGTESFVFNKLEEFADLELPRTPVLGAGITEALQRKNISKGAFLTSRINWAIQSSGVDYLHLLIVSMDYMIKKYGLNARLMITVHDEIRYIVQENDKYKVAMALQIANLWTRSMFSHQMGIDDLPQSCAFFSAVDIDHVLRKEVDLECVTPSNPDPIPPGESIDIQQLLAKPEALLPFQTTGSEDTLDPKLETISYTPSAPVMAELAEASGSNIYFMRAQIAKEDQELAKAISDMRKEAPQLVRQTGLSRFRKKIDSYTWIDDGYEGWEHISVDKMTRPLPHQAREGFGWSVPDVTSPPKTKRTPRKLTARV
ncbi:hypothetical protein ABW19_dt0209168 [Dactylella cylindrospora]|nr:hypothetical protein ABW19_dt0209168 [Dactylella cylindrospora]